MPSLSSESEARTTILASASSDGKIRVYDLAQLSTDPILRLKDEESVQQLNPVALYDTKGSRLTCLALADGEASRSNVSVGNKRQAPLSDGEAGDENEGNAVSDESEGMGEEQVDHDAKDR